MTRTINAPGIEINEKDRSQYDETVDQSIVGTSTLLMGVADKGDDYSTKFINNMNTFVRNYGYPTTEAERYFYNGAYEILDRGGILYTSKLPYDNEVLNKYAYNSYFVENTLNYLSSPYDILNDIKGILKAEDGSDVNLYDFLLMPNIKGEYTPDVSYENMKNIVETEHDGDEITYEDEKTYDFLRYFDECGISLSIVNDLMSYISEKCNFQYFTEEAFNRIFKNQDNGKYRNDSVYMLSDLNYNKEEFKRIYDPENELSAEIDSIYDSLQTIGSFEEQIKSFGKSISLKYAREYFYGLSAEVESEKGKIGGTETQSLLMDVLEGYNDTEKLNMKLTGVKKLDDSISSYLNIRSSEQISRFNGYISLDEIDAFKTGNKTPQNNQIIFVDITRQKYQYDRKQGKYNEYIGTTAVITTPVNALYYQGIISNNDESTEEYNAIKDLRNIWSDNKYRYIDENEDEHVLTTDVMLDGLNNDKEDITGFVQNLGNEKFVNNNLVTLSHTAASFFPQFTYSNNILDDENLKKIGVVVFKMYIDKASDDRIAFMPVESFVGSLNKYAKNRLTGQSIFIDSIINTNSKYINCFSNVMFSTNETIKKFNTDFASTFVITDQTITSLGFYEKDCGKIISLKETINKALPVIFENNKDTTTVDVDIVLDGGVTNIAQFIKSVYPKNNRGYYDFSNSNSYRFKMETSEDIKQWYVTASSIDTFCRNTRKDCMFILDGPRALCLKGQNEKNVRGNKPENSITNQILKRMKIISNVFNSSYTAGYCDWFLQTDHYSNEYFWIPPSIKVVGNYLYTDTYSKYWMAPAGMNRGVINRDVVDVAFSPTVQEAGVIYDANWNYAVSYPLQGIVIEGQKTMQKNKTAFDRVNIRRLFLGMEKNVRQIARYFRYENITNYMLSQFREQIESYLYTVQNGGGISEFSVVCDERNNNN